MAYVPKGRPRGRPTKAEAALRAFSPLALKPYRIGSAPPLPPLLGSLAASLRRILFPCPICSARMKWRGCCSLGCLPQCGL